MTKEDSTRDVILFDLDGTLLDTHDAILDSMRFATRSVLGADLSDEVLVAQVGQPLITQMRTLAPDERIAQELLVVYRARNEEDLDRKTSPFKGISELIVSLKAEGFIVAVVTSKREELAIASLKTFGLFDLFACVNGLESSKAHKPHPDPLFQAASDLGVSLDRCLYIGDSPFDIQAAKAAGIPSIGVTWGGFFSREELEEQAPSLIAETPDDLHRAICRLA